MGCSEVFMGLNNPVPLLHFLLSMAVRQSEEGTAVVMDPSLHPKDQFAWGLKLNSLLPHVRAAQAGGWCSLLEEPACGRGMVERAQSLHSSWQGPVLLVLTGCDGLGRSLKSWSLEKIVFSFFPSIKEEEDPMSPTLLYGLCHSAHTMYSIMHAIKYTVYMAYTIMYTIYMLHTIYMACTIMNAIMCTIYTLYTIMHAIMFTIMCIMYFWYYYLCVCVLLLLFSYSVVSDSLRLWIIAHQAPVREISQARRILEWVAISFSRRSSWSRCWTCVSCIGRRILYHWVTREPCILCVLLYILFMLYEV